MKRDLTSSLYLFTSRVNFQALHWSSMKRSTQSTVAKAILLYLLPVKTSSGPWHILFNHQRQWANITEDNQKTEWIHLWEKLHSHSHHVALLQNQQSFSSDMYMSTMCSLCMIYTSSCWYTQDLASSICPHAPPLHQSNHDSKGRPEEM